MKRLKKPGNQTLNNVIKRAGQEVGSHKHVPLERAQSGETDLGSLFASTGLSFLGMIKSLWLPILNDNDVGFINH